jgi:hypothetical protein
MILAQARCSWQLLSGHRVGLVQIKKVARIQFLVPQEFITGTVKIVAAALGDDIDDGARKAAVFGVKRISDQPEFLDGVERGNNGRTIVAALLDIPTIHQESVGCRSSGRRKEPTL